MDNSIGISKHASKRLLERGIDFNSKSKSLQEAIDKLSKKGARESLVITKDVAFIIDVVGRRLITAISLEEMSQNIITKIDSTLFI